MQLEDIIKQTQSVLPLFTPNFTTNITITSVSKTGDDVTVVASGHKLKVGDEVLISGVKTDITITNLTVVDNIATAITNVDHDLTPGYTNRVEVISAESAFAGKFDLIATPTPVETTFTYKITGVPAGPSTGTLRTFHNLGFNGVQTVTEVVNSTTFKYVLVDDRLTSGSGDDMLLMKEPRISGAADLDRLIVSYTKRKDLLDISGFFVFNGMTVSKDRTLNNDANLEIYKSIDHKIRLINDFTFYIFIPTHSSVSARDALDIAQKTTAPLYRSIISYTPKSEFVTTQELTVMPASHQVIEYVPPYLIYGYDFQVSEFMSGESGTQDIDKFMGNTGDILPNLNTSAFRQFKSKIKNDFDTIVKDDNFKIQD